MPIKDDSCETIAPGSRPAPMRGQRHSMSHLDEIVNLTLFRKRLAFNPEAHVILCLQLRQTTLTTGVLYPRYFYSVLSSL